MEYSLSSFTTLCVGQRVSCSLQRVVGTVKLLCFAYSCTHDELSGWGAANACVVCSGTALVEELDKLLMVQLRDGRKIMGILRCAGPCFSAWAVLGRPCNSTLLRHFPV